MRKVLIVDDTDDCLQPLARLLRVIGHTVDCAHNGEEALRVVERFEPDVIILDYMMPVMDGLTFLEHLRADPRRHDLRVLVFTGCDAGINTDRLHELGTEDVLFKGAVDFNRLATIVEPQA